MCETDVFRPCTCSLLLRLQSPQPGNEDLLTRPSLCCLQTKDALNTSRVGISSKDLHIYRSLPLPGSIISTTHVPPTAADSQAHACANEKPLYGPAWGSKQDNDIIDVTNKIGAQRPLHLDLSDAGLMTGL
ncbi:hypothetical protein NDU88_006947 [Pleurodeles waltl]|uniref:Uncharacterized protein n=1 Tax=Pleurodeles waltl TaxID=8319 RepID=A0AAV7TYH0_PLEWA|nr:hypothetical protein NDU88_006947 [Pleurodeles waltl]